MAGDRTQTAVERLIAEPKGKITYTPGQSFLLHVFWQCPSMDAAKSLLGALGKCAAATHRDTPCVPIYFFRISNNNASLSTSKPQTINDHPALGAALRKLRIGVPRPAVLADLNRRGLDAALLDLDPSDRLPENLQQHPVAFECTELYLDERAFNEHAGSRDYLAAYSTVIDPSLQDRHFTVRMGTPTEYLVDRILEPMLHERVRDMVKDMCLWRNPSRIEAKIFISLDISMEEASGSEQLPNISLLCLNDQYVHKIVFEHPLREKTARFLGVLSALPESDLVGFEAIAVQRGEIHCDESVMQAMADALGRRGLEDVITVNATDSVGYILHSQGGNLKELKP